MGREEFGGSWEGLDFLIKKKTANKVGTHPPTQAYQSIHEGFNPMTQTLALYPHLQHWGLNFNVRFGGVEYPNQSSYTLASSVDKLMVVKSDILNEPDKEVFRDYILKGIVSQKKSSPLYKPFFWLVMTKIIEATETYLKLLSI